MKKSTFSFLKGFSIGLAVSGLLILGLVLLNLPEKLGVESTAIVRLHDANTGDFFCSGVVVNKTTIITAAHCLAYRPENNPGISVRGADGVDLGVLGTSIKYLATPDYGIMKGNFRLFSTKKIITDPTLINKLAIEGSLVICGYPYSGPLVCTPLKNVQRFGFFLRGLGFLYPGMSGGPVIDTNTGLVIAINSAVQAEWSYVAPLVNILVELNEAE